MLAGCLASDDGAVFRRFGLQLARAILFRVKAVHTGAKLRDYRFDHGSFDTVDDVVTGSGHKVAIWTNLYIDLQQEKHISAIGPLPTPLRWRKRKLRSWAGHTCPSNSSLRLSYLSSLSHANTLYGKGTWSALAWMVTGMMPLKGHAITTSKPETPVGVSKH